MFDVIRYQQMKVEAEETLREATKMGFRAHEYARKNCPHENKETRWYTESNTWGQENCLLCGLFLREVMAEEEHKNHYRGPDPKVKEEPC